jgi:hypothetical protein
MSDIKTATLNLSKLFVKLYICISWCFCMSKMTLCSFLGKLPILEIEIEIMVQITITLGIPLDPNVGIPRKVGLTFVQHFHFKKLKKQSWLMWKEGDCWPVWWLRWLGWPLACWCHWRWCHSIFWLCPSWTWTRTRPGPAPPGSGPLTRYQRIHPASWYLHRSNKNKKCCFYSTVPLLALSNM